MNASIIVFFWIKLLLTKFNISFYSPKFCPKEWHCPTHDLQHSKRLRDKCLCYFNKNVLKCTQMYHLCTLYCSFMHYQLSTDIEPITKSPMLTIMNFPQIKLLTGAILMTS